MNTKERKFSHWMRGNLPGMTVPIENAIASGMPDLINIYQEEVLFIELKCGEFLIRPSQYAWGRRACANGGRVMVVRLAPDDRLEAIFYPFHVQLAGGSFLKPEDKTFVASCDRLSLTHSFSVYQWLTNGYDQSREYL